MRQGRIEPYKKSRGLNAALRNIQDIAKRGEAAQIGAIYVGNREMLEKIKSYVSSQCEVDLNLIVASHVGPNTTGIAIEWAGQKPF